MIGADGTRWLDNLLVQQLEQLLVHLLVAEAWSAVCQGLHCPSKCTTWTVCSALLTIQPFVNEHNREARD